jgi:hypothetical protein
MTTNGNSVKGQAPPPLPLVPEVFKASDRVKAVTFKLFSIPGDNNAPKINFEIRPINGSETLCECLVLFQDVKKIRKGCNVQDEEQYNTVLRNILQALALQAYDRAINDTLVKTWKELHTQAINAAVKEKRDAGEDPPTPAQILTLRNGVQKPAVDQFMITKGVQAVISYMAPTKALAKQTA